MSKRRDYCFTLNNYSEDEWASVVATTGVKFAVYAKEVCPTTGTPHIQGYWYFESPRSFNFIKKQYPKIHLEPPIGNANDNLIYIQGPYEKDGKFKPFNPDAVVIGQCPSQGKRNDLSKAKSILQQTGKMSDVVEVVTSYQSVRMCETILKYKEKQRNWKPNVKWFYGKTGTGKTREAYELLGDTCYTCLNGKWWEGYDAHENVILDDIRSDFLPFDFFIRLLDRYPYRVECKGGSRQFLAKNIIITAPFHPSRYACGSEDIGQLLRRIDEIKLFGEADEII